MNAGKKRIFIILIALSLGVFALLFGAASYLIRQQSPWLNQLVIKVTECIFLLGLVIVVTAIIVLVYSLLSKKNFKHLSRFARGVIEFFYPIVVTIGQWVGIEKSKIQSSYIQISNQMVELAHTKVEPKDVLILAPHCLQNVQCPHKITVDVHNCKRCGRCSIDGLLRVSEEQGVQLVIATGGTFARKFVQEIHPKGIVAIACERDLTSGIQDVHQIPVVGVLNDRPNGPCYNTSVQLDKVEQAVEHFIRGGM